MFCWNFHRFWHDQDMYWSRCLITKKLGKNLVNVTKISLEGCAGVIKMSSFNWSFLEQILPQILNVTAFILGRVTKYMAFFLCQKVVASQGYTIICMSFFLHGQIKWFFFSRCYFVQNPYHKFHIWKVFCFHVVF